MAIQVRTISEQVRSLPEASRGMDKQGLRSASVEPEEEQEQVAGMAEGGPVCPDIFAHSVEFVTPPGRAKELQKTIPETLRRAFGNSGGFFGCMVFVSKQEARLMTVITLWTGRDRAEQCDKISDRLHQVLRPYVDCWLRTQRMATLLCWPQTALSAEESEALPVLRSSVAQ